MRVQFHRSKRDEIDNFNPEKEYDNNTVVKNLKNVNKSNCNKFA